MLLQAFASFASPPVHGHYNMTISSDHLSDPRLQPEWRCCGRPPTDAVAQPTPKKCSPAYLMNFLMKYTLSSESSKMVFRRSGRSLRRVKILPDGNIY